MLFLYGLCGLMSIQSISLSLSLVPGSETVATNCHVAPWSVDLYNCTSALIPLIPIVAVHTVPSVMKATAGSEWDDTPPARGSSVWRQVSPPSDEKYCFWRPVKAMLPFEAATRMFGSDGSCAMEDSLLRSLALVRLMFASSA